MSHDATKVLLGSTPSSSKVVDNIAGSPTTFKAGLCVHLNSSGALSLASADGSKLGISLGKSLAGNDRVAVCRKGLRVPILLADGLTPTKGAAVQISTTTGTAVASGTTVNAVYATSTLTGIQEDGTEVNVALIDMQGGL